MSTKVKLTALISLICILLSPITFAKLIPLASCSQLQNPKTILAVHASWCPACKRFMPTYETLSNNSQYKGWTFYEKVDDNWANICNTVIPDVPHLFVDNMKELPNGDDLDVLTKYLDTHNQSS